MITADFHMHTNHSADSDATMSEQINAAISKGLTDLCFTEHMDMDFPKEKYGIDFLLDTDKYQEEYLTCKKTYKDKINLLFGVELGLQPHLTDRHADYINSYPFDFVIGSAHLCDGIDVYYPEFYEGRSEKEAYRRYFEYELECINTYMGFDVFGHLDYIVRYGPNKDKFYKYTDHCDLIDEILCKLVQNGKGLEINTSQLNKGFNHPNPTEDILKQYRHLGGEIITVGSDAHAPENIGGNFDKARDILIDCGFKYYCTFKERKPIYKPL